MFKYRFLFATMVAAAMAMAMIHVAEAGEKVSTSAISVRTKWHSIEVGDEGGHTIAVYENKQVYADEADGEKSTGVNSGILDMNFKTGTGTVNGYVVRTFANGDKLFSTYSGGPAGKGYSKGAYTIVSGTGGMEGVTGSGTWTSTTLAPGVSQIEFDGERSMPAKK